MKRVRARDLIGRTITAVDFRVFQAGLYTADKATNPILTLDNGRKLWFSVDETETGEYGVQLLLTERKRK